MDVFTESNLPYVVGGTIFITISIIGTFVMLTLSRWRRAYVAAQGKTKAELQSKEELLNLFITHTPMAVAMFDKKMCYLMTSSRWLTDHHLGDENIIGNCHYEVFPMVSEEDREIHRRCLKGETQERREEYFERSDGSSDWIRWEARPWRQTNGDIGGIIIFTEIISEQVKASENLIKSREQYERLIRNLPDTIDECDENGVVRFTNRDEQVGLGKHVCENLPAENHDALKECMAKARSTGEIQHIEISFEQEGVLSWSEYRILPAWEKDRKFVIISTNISKLKTTEQALREAQNHLEQKVKERTAELTAANDELKAFAYIVSHDLRAPLVNITGFIGELRYSMEPLISVFQRTLPYVDEATRMELKNIFEYDIPEAMNFIESSASSMDKLLKAVLEFSRLGHRRLDFRRQDVKQIIDKTLDSLAYIIEQSEIQIDIGNIEDVVADRTSLMQIFNNLLTNAVHYLDPKRPGHIQIESKQDGNFTLFQVKDNGVGIPSEDVQDIFKLFKRSGASSVPGEGIGLAFVVSLVNRHGGQVWCDSTVGVGSTFSFTISNRLKDEIKIA